MGLDQSNCMWKPPPPVSLGIRQRELQQSHGHSILKTVVKKKFLILEKYFPGAEDSVSAIKQSRNIQTGVILTLFLCS